MTFTDAVSELERYVAAVNALFKAHRRRVRWWNVWNGDH